MNSSRNPLPLTHTKRFTDVLFEHVQSCDLFIVPGDATETRGNSPLWNDIMQSTPNRLVTLELDGREHVKIHRSNSDCVKASLRDDTTLASIFTSQKVLIDISGMSNQLWPSILRVAYQANIYPKIMYVEPDSYKQHATPASTSFFDLTHSFEGLSPLPGFAKLSGPPDESETILVALLGFEGNRSTRLAMQIEPTPKVVPIVGLPGFQVEFPAYTIACNREILKEYDAHGHIRYARASCPFETYSALEDIRKDYPNSYMYLAPVGTKPHSLGAVWFALKNPSTTEILYDYPIRKTGRTDGVGVVHIYDFGELNAT